MPIAMIDGLATTYEDRGSGAPILFLSPGGFDATMDKWWSLGIYARTQPIGHLERAYRCILFDRRECGQSGGRIERVSWNTYARQALGMLDHLGIDKAVIAGGCMGVSPALSLACSHPERVKGLILYWPVGGARYRINGHRRFADHLAFARREGLAAVVELVRTSRKSFSGDPRGGPWASAILNSSEFAAAYSDWDIEAYSLIVTAMVNGLLDRDTAPGAEPEDLMRCAIPALVIPGADASHARSAAHYIAECLTEAELWDVAVADQSEEATAARMRMFLEGLGD